MIAKEWTNIDETARNMIRNHMKANEVTIYAVAKKSGVTAIQLTRYLNEKQSMVATNLSKVLKSLNE